VLTIQGWTCSCSESGLAVADADFGQTNFSGLGVGRVSARGDATSLLLSNLSYLAQTIYPAGVIVVSS